jgi:hypothetical protein
MSSTTYPDRVLYRHKDHVVLIDPLFDTFRYEIYRDADGGRLIPAGCGPLPDSIATLDAGLAFLVSRFNDATGAFEVYPPVALDQARNRLAKNTSTDTEDRTEPPSSWTSK